MEEVLYMSALEGWMRLGDRNAPAGCDKNPIWMQRQKRLSRWSD
jgi:hypothetical protein